MKNPKDITKEWMIKKIEFSNSEAAENRNFYPIQEQVTQTEIWEYVPCDCDDTCICKKFGCTHHWKIKNDLQFEEFLFGFLRVFVPRCDHLSMINAMGRKDSSNLFSRVSDAYPLLRSLEKNWPVISKKAADHNKTLFCDGWADDFFKREWSFKINGTSVYQAKQYCILLPDICIPYDSDSRKKILKCVEITQSDIKTEYLKILNLLRERFLKCIEENHLSIQEFRSFDSPGKYLPFDKKLISLRSNRDYGIGYLPKERPISFVIDKCFYNPNSSSKKK